MNSTKDVAQNIEVGGTSMASKSKNEVNKGVAEPNTNNINAVGSFTGGNKSAVDKSVLSTKDNVVGGVSGK